MFDLRIQGVAHNDRRSPISMPAVSIFASHVVFPAMHSSITKYISTRRCCCALATGTRSTVLRNNNGWLLPTAFHLRSLYLAIWPYREPMNTYISHRSASTALQEEHRPSGSAHTRSFLDATRRANTRLGAANSTWTVIRSEPPALLLFPGLPLQKRASSNSYQ